MSIIDRIGGYTPDGESVCVFRITNQSGFYVELTNWGARWIAAVVPDAEGHPDNVLVGYNDMSGYLTDTYYMGATVGRFANRIHHAAFTIESKVYNLEMNDGKNTNHGGYAGFHQRLWQWEKLVDGIRFTLTSPDGEGGYPGNLSVSVEYRWSEQNELSIHYSGKTDKPTYLNMTNHAYFNLSGARRKITSQMLHIPSDKILDTTSEFIPTGEMVSVANTPFDFTTCKPIGKDLYADNEQLHWNRGYNHCYVLKENKSQECIEAAFLYDPQTKRSLAVKTDLPGVLVYTAGYYEYPDTAVCLETQYFPDTPSHPHFPSCLLKPEEEYNQLTVYRFGVY